jgi:hypothetical protein
MVLGNELHTGGKPLESNVIERKLEFFKTFGEHIQTLGERKTVTGNLDSSGTSTTVYTVPDDKNFYLFFLNITGSNVDANNVRKIEVYLDFSDKSFGHMLLIPTSDKTHTMTYPIPIRVDSGQSFILLKSSSDLDLRASCQIWGFEVNREISIQ